MNVNVVMGGPSAEYDVSILTGGEMVRHLLQGSHTVRAVVFDAERNLHMADVGPAGVPNDTLAAPANSDQFTGPFAPAASQPVWEGCDVALLAVHGSFGEDGNLQGFLETIDVPYTGSGVEASSVSMDKIATKLLLQQTGIETPPYSVYGPLHSATLESIASEHGFPCYAKCPQSGSSKLMGRADDADSLGRLLAELSEHSDDILVEAAVEGYELSCPVLTSADGTTRAFQPVEIRPISSVYFDYEAKYTEGACEDVCPMQRPPELIQEAQDISIRVHRLLGCHGVSRTDMICSSSELSVLEINTLPGFTPTSLVPMSFAAEGGTYLQLLEILMEAAICRHREAKS